MDPGSIILLVLAGYLATVVTFKQLNRLKAARDELDRYETAFLNTLRRRKILHDDGKVHSPPIPFVRMDLEPMIALCGAFGKRSKDEPPPSIETNSFHMRFYKLGGWWDTVEAEMLRCNAKYALMDIGDPAHVYILRRGRFRRSHGGHPLFRIIEELTLNVNLTDQRTKWLAKKFPDEVQEKYLYPIAEKKISYHSYSVEGPNLLPPAKP